MSLITDFQTLIDKVEAYYATVKAAAESYLCDGIPAGAEDAADRKREIIHILDNPLENFVPGSNSDDSRYVEIISYMINAQEKRRRFLDARTLLKEYDNILKFLEEASAEITRIENEIVQYKIILQEANASHISSIEEGMRKLAVLKAAQLNIEEKIKNAPAFIKEKITKLEAVKGGIETRLAEIKENSLQGLTAEL